ncbi:hypothetical protein [Azospirillum sp.]|uniref:hypothetical protein n=1 Tax=Azospirillum sp. TaxID=34012 RepID=UPI00262510C4|nr:hypothetical protein [Azospirillum sp.]
MAPRKRPSLRDNLTPSDAVPSAVKTRAKSKAAAAPVDAPPVAVTVEAVEVPVAVVPAAEALQAAVVVDEVPVVVAAPEEAAVKAVSVVAPPSDASPASEIFALETPAAIPAVVIEAPPVVAAIAAPPVADQAPLLAASPALADPAPPPVAASAAPPVTVTPVMETVVSSAPSDAVEKPTTASISQPAFIPAPPPARSSGGLLATVAVVLATAGLAAAATTPLWSPQIKRQVVVTRALDERVASVETRLGATTAAAGPLAERVTALEGALAALDRKVAALPDPKAFGALAIAQLTSALDDSDPFAAELVAVRASGVADETLKKALDALVPRAATGIPTFDALAESFVLIVPDALAADLRAAAEEAKAAAEAQAAAAPAAPAAAPVPAAPAVEAPASADATASAAATATDEAVVADAGPGIVDQLWSALYSAADLLRVVSFSGGEARKAAMVLEQAGVLLASGDLVAAVELLGSLEGAAAQAYGPWLDDARARVAANQASALLTARSAALLSSKS